jgi:hypothetical protein
VAFPERNKELRPLISVHLLSVKATTIRTDAVGAAQDTRATALGTSGKTHADALATAGTTYVSATSSADVAYINAAASADNGLVAAVTGADTTFANKSATANRTLTGSLGAANVKLVQDTGAATVTQSHTIAASEAEFHQEEIHQNVSRWSNLIGYTPTELIPYETEYRQALDQAIYSWRAVTRSAFTDFVTNSTQADTDQTSDVADAGRVQANAKGDADVAFTASSSPLAATLRRNTASTINDYTVGTVTRDNARLTELANALATLTKDEGEAEKTRAIDVAAAEHTWQSAKAQAEEDYTAIQTQAEKTLAAAVLAAEINYYNDSDYAAYLAAIEAAGEIYSDTVDPAAHTRWTTLQEAELTYKQTVGDADLALATAKSASREGWVDATVDAEKQFVDDESHAIQQRRDDIAGYQQTYATSLASVVGDRDVDNAEALTDFWDAEQEADNTWLASAAAAQAGFWDADYMQSPHLGLSLPLPWTGAMNSLGGAALQAWQFSARSGYMGLASSINSTNTAYQDTLTSQYRSLANSLRTTDVSLATSLADAEHTHATTFASLESQFFVDMADLSNTYLHDTEEASHVSRVASATATRHLFVGIDYDGNNFGQTEFSAALSAASVVFSEARQEIERIYDRGDVTTFGAFNIALATNTHGYFATSTAANLSHTQGTAALERGYSHQEAAANHARETMVAGLDENYRRLESAALAGEVASFLGSPWLVLNKELVDTDNDFRQAESTAAEALRTAVADADQTLENAAADALETLTNRLAEIGAEEVMAEADGELNNAIATAIESITDFHAGKTNPANPTLPSLPRVYSHAIDAVIEEDYASAGEFYEGSAYWGWDNGFYTNSLRFFGTQPTNRSNLPQSFPKLYQVSRDLERHIAERREFALSYELMMEGYYYTDEALSSFEAIGRLGDYYHEFVRTNIEVPTGAIEGLGAGVVFAFTDEGKGADHAFGARSAPKAMEFSDEPGTDDNTDTTDVYGGSGPGLPGGNHPTSTGGDGGARTADGPIYGPAPPPDHRLPRPEEKRLSTITITEFVESLENAKRDETVNADTVYDKYIELFGTQGIALFAWAVQNGWEIRYTDGFGTPWINTTDKVIVIQAFMPMQGIASNGFGVIHFKRDKPERHTVEFAARELHKLLKAAYAHAADTETKRLELDAMLGGDDYLGMAWPERYYRFNTAWMLNSWIGCGILHAENACMGETILGHELTTRKRLWLGAVGSVETILSATGIASLGGGAIGNKVAKSVLTPAAYRALSVDIVQHLGEHAVRALISSPSGKEFLRAVARQRLANGAVSYSVTNGTSRATARLGINRLNTSTLLRELNSSEIGRQIVRAAEDGLIHLLSLT